MFSVAGDSMIYVNKDGRRVVNEKLAYNEMAQVFFQWDGAKRRVSEPRADRRSGISAARSTRASDEYGRLIVPPGTDDSARHQGRDARRA